MDETNMDKALRGESVPVTEIRLNELRRYAMERGKLPIGHPEQLHWHWPAALNELAALRARVEALERAADNVIRCNTFTCMFPYPHRCPAQCQADAALRALLRKASAGEGPAHE